MSMLLSRLDQQISIAVDPVLAAELQVRKACYLSRTGYVDAARDILVEVRKHFGAGESARVSILIMLAEGILAYFETSTSTDSDRIARAQLIALAVKDRELSALTAAWKAHLEFEKSDYQSMLASLRLVFKLGDDSNHQALARASSVISNVCFMLGDRQRGQYWFMKCRDHALADGDQAMLDAILHNKAACGIADLRCKQCFGAVDAAEIDLVRLEVASTTNYEMMTQTKALNQLNRVLAARVHILQGNYEKAVIEFRRIRDAGAFAKTNLSDKYVVLEMVYCLMCLGQYDAAFELFGNVADCDFLDFDIDDKLIVAWLKVELCKMHPSFGNVAKAEIAFEVISGQFLSHKEALLDTMTEFH